MEGVNEEVSVGGRREGGWTEGVRHKEREGGK